MPAGLCTLLYPGGFPPFPGEELRQQVCGYILPLPFGSAFFLFRNPGYILPILLYRFSCYTVPIQAAHGRVKFNHTSGKDQKRTYQNRQSSAKTFHSFTSILFLFCRDPSRQSAYYYKNIKKTYGLKWYFFTINIMKSISCPILPGRHSVFCFKLSVKIRQILKSDVCRHSNDLIVCSTQRFCRFC